MFKLDLILNGILILFPYFKFIGNLMQEVAQATFMFEHFPEVMGMLWKRMLHENKKNWRRTYKVSVIKI